ALQARSMSARRLPSVQPVGSNRAGSALPLILMTTLSLVCVAILGLQFVVVVVSSYYYNRCIPVSTTPDVVTVKRDGAWCKRHPDRAVALPTHLACVRSHSTARLCRAA